MCPFWIPPGIAARRHGSELDAHDHPSQEESPEQRMARPHHAHDRGLWGGRCSPDRRPRRRGAAGGLRPPAGRSRRDLDPPQSAAEPAGHQRQRRGLRPRQRPSPVLRGRLPATLNDTWSWDGFDWTQLHPAHSPQPRFGAALAYDPATRQLLLFGGEDDSTSTMYGDTWEWTGTDWQQLAPAASPAARSYGSLAYDAATRQLVLFGGQTLDRQHPLLRRHLGLDGDDVVGAVASDQPFGPHPGRLDL